MPLSWITGNTAGARNRERVRQEGKEYRAAKEQWRFNENQRKEEYEYAKTTRDNQIKDNEANLRFQEESLINDYNYRTNVQNYEFDIANRAYYRSVSQAAKQKEYNQMAAENANMEQDLKLRDDLLGVMFDESDSMLNYISKSSGFTLTKNKRINDANFKLAEVEQTFRGQLGEYQLERRKQRSQSQIESQSAIVAGMKLAGEIRAKAGAGRSGAKAVLGVMAESGATRAAIANGLMYAEQGIDLGIAQIKDMLILDQTMVLAAKDFAENDYDLSSSTLDATRDTDKIKIAASRQSIKDRDKVVRRIIETQRAQADLKAESSVLMRPERLPSMPDPRTRFAKYDNPATEDYVEMLLRPTITEFPEYRPTREPERDDFRGPRENVGMSTFGDILGFAGMAAGGIGAFGAGLGMFSSATGTGAAWSAAGASLSGLSKSFYPRGY